MVLKQAARAPWEIKQAEESVLTCRCIKGLLKLSSLTGNFLGDSEMEEEIQTSWAKAGVEVWSCSDCFMLLEHGKKSGPEDAIRLVHDIDHTADTQVAGPWRIPSLALPSCRVLEVLSFQLLSKLNKTC